MDATAVTPALSALESGQHQAPAVLALGLSGRAEFAPLLRDTAYRYRGSREVVSACLVGLQLLGDRSVEAETLFIDCLTLAEYRPLAGWALLRFRSERSDEALLETLRDSRESRNGLGHSLGINLLHRPSTRTEGCGHALG